MCKTDKQVILMSVATKNLFFVPKINLSIAKSRPFASAQGDMKQISNPF